MKGLEALTGSLARAAEAIYGIPGYPVTGLAEQTGAELVTNEKVALEYAIGDSIAGRRSAVILKNVGLNVAADPLVNATTQGLRSGVVIVAGDDPGVVASQNAQDSRYYGEIAQVPVIEPDAETCVHAVEEAFAASERFSRVALIRITPPLLDAEVTGEIPPPRRSVGRLAPRRLTMKGRAMHADRTYAEMCEWSRDHRFNRLRGGAVGIGTAPGKSRLVVVYPPPPLPVGAGEINELGRPFVREHRICEPPRVDLEPENMQTRGYFRTFCPGCPFKTAISILADRGLSAVCDVGCALLAMNPPYSAGIACYGLGSSVGVAARSTGVAICGDYAMVHSGVNALIDVYEKATPLLCIVLKNARLGMTGGHRLCDVARYLSGADPEVCDGNDRAALERLLVMPGEPKTVIIEGTCPEGEEHETVHCE